MDEFGSGGQNEAEYSIVCGSPGEVANDALLGHQLAITHGGEFLGFSAIWVCRGPQVLVFGSIHQDSILGADF